MSKGIIIAMVDVTDPEAFQAYGAKAKAAVDKHGGHYIARGGRTISLEGAPAPQRVVLIEFPSLEAAEAYYNSPEYQDAKAARDGAADARFIAVEGA